MTALVTYDLTKTFGGTVALRAVDFVIEKGEVHGLVGQNGSGKSTLIKILAGYHAPDPGGRVEIGGAEVALPIDAARTRELGLHFIHQDLGLVPGLSVTENMRVGRFRTGLGGRISWRRERALVRRALERFELEIDPRAAVATLRPVERALLAIARGLDELEASGEAGVLFLDEPTAYLSHDGVDRLRTAVKQVAEAGTAVVFVSHRLDEIRTFTDKVTVLRDGVKIGTVEPAKTSEGEFINMILGRSLDDLYPEQHEHAAEAWGAVEGLTGGRVKDVSLEIRRGEILGLTGLVGMGYEEVPQLLVGAERARAGVLRLEQESSEVAAITPRRARGLGMVYLPADRLGQSGVAAMSLAENVSLPVLSDYFRGGLLRRRPRDAEVGRLLSAYAVKPPRPAALLGELSGGNQQKALLAKWLQVEPRLLLLVEPTQGVDVGAKKEIFAQLSALAERGSAIVISSSEYEDLAHLCNRVAVFRHGEVTAVLGEEGLSEQRILETSYTAGAQNRHGGAA